MLSNGLLLTNKVLLVLFALAIVYNYVGAPLPNIARGIGQFIPLVVLALTIVAATRKTTRLARSALVANVILCFVASGVFLFAAVSDSLGAGVATIILFIPFFMNTYFLVKYRPAPNAL